MKRLLSALKRMWKSLLRINDRNDPDKPETIGWP